ncbi:MAG: hypothetical protein V4750_06050 [Pseudomonadota bacterium]
MQQLVPNQLNAHVPVNENFATLVWASVYGKDPTTTAGLHRGYLGGRWGGFDAAAVDHTFGASTTTYVCVDLADGTLNFSTSDTNYLDTANFATVETVPSGASSIVAASVIDDRTSPGGVWNRASLSGGGDLLAANNLSDVANAATARTNLGVDTAIASAISAIGLSGFRYKIELANTTASDPGAGLLKFNHATPGSATALYLDDSTFDSVDLRTLLGSLGSSGLVKITSVSDVGEWRVFKWTATPTDNTGWWTFTVIDQAGTGTFEDDDEVQVLFLQLGAGGAGGDTLSSEGALIASATAKTTPVDADYIGLMDSAASNVLKKLSWLNIKATLKTYFDTLYLALAGGTLSGALNEAPAVTIASSTTPAIFAAAGNTINLTGTTTVTGFDTIAAGAVRRVIFGGILQLTYHATSMQNLTAANITTAAGDVAEFESLGSGNTKMLAYTRVSGAALAGSAGAGTKTYGIFTASDFQPPATNYATFDTRNSRALDIFDDSVNESILIAYKLPEGAVTTSGLKVIIEFKAAAATSGTMNWEAAFEKGTTDSDTDSFDTSNTGSAAVNGTSGISTVLTITCTNIDSLVAGDHYILKITRDASDSVTGFGQLCTVEVQGV